MLLVFRRRFGGLRGYGVMLTTGKALAASTLVAALSLGSYALLIRAPLPGGFIGELVLVGVCAGLGALGYLVGARALKLVEVETLIGAFRRRLGR